MYRLRLKEILNQRGISRNKLSRGADVPLNTIQKMCNQDGFNPTGITLLKVASYLGISVEELYSQEEDETERPELV